MNQVWTSLVLVACLIALAEAQYPPRFPLRGQFMYTAYYKDEPANAYSGGKAVFDFVLGLVRHDIYKTDDPLTLTSVTVFRLRENKAYVINENNCIIYKLQGNQPKPPDWSDYKYEGFDIVGPHLTETWVQPSKWGGFVSVDVFDRDIVAFGNASSALTEQWVNVLRAYQTEPPSGRQFVVPDELQCKQSNLTTMSLINKCSICKAAVNSILGTLCSAGGVFICSLVPPIAPFCGALAGAICASGCSGAKCAQIGCQKIRLC